jgi:hypothetical protein
MRSRRQETVLFGVAIGIVAVHAAADSFVAPEPDGLDLAGWYVRSRNGAALISYPTRQRKLAQASMLVRHEVSTTIRRWIASTARP